MYVLLAAGLVAQHARWTPGFVPGLLDQEQSIAEPSAEPFSSRGYRLSEAYLVVAA